jgi:hypothetical protein
MVKKTVALHYKGGGRKKNWQENKLQAYLLPVANYGKQNCKN